MLITLNSTSLEPEGNYDLSHLLTHFGELLARIINLIYGVDEFIATAKAVRTQNVRRAQWHLVNNQTALVFCGFDFLTKTSISQYC
jgi:hypothetical protein